MATNEARTIVGWTVDQASKAQVIQANQAIAQSYTSIADQIAALGLAGEQVFLGGEDITASLVVPMDTASASVKSLIRDIGDLGRDIQAIPEPDLSAFGVADDQATGGGFDLTSKRRGISAIGGLLGSQAGGGAFGDAAKVISVGAAFGLVGVAGASLAVVLSKVSEAEQAAAVKGKSFVDTLNGIESNQSTSKDIQKSIDDLTKLKATQASTYSQLNELHERYLYLITHAELPDTKDQLHALETQTAALSGGTLAVENLSGATDEAKANLDDTTNKLGVYTVALGSQATKANDAVEAVEAVGTAFGKMVHDFFSGSVGITAQGFDLGAIVGDFLKDRSAIVSAQTDAYFDLLQKEAATSQKIYDIQSQEADVRLAENVREQTIITDGAERRAQIIQDEQDNIAKIVRDAGREQAADVRARNVDAFLTSKTHEKDATDDQAKALGKQLTQQQRAQDKQIASQRAALATQVATLDRSLQAQQTILAQEKFAETSIALAGSQDLRVIHSDFWQDVNMIAVTFAANTVNTLRSIFSQQLSSGTPNSPLTKAVENIFDARFRAIHAP